MKRPIGKIAVGEESWGKSRPKLDCSVPNDDDDGGGGDDFLNLKNIYQV